ncbi:dihydropyrimidinase [Verruconis gallopava]|uniref:Dihydropyrimidinase n=1 Tax=Verruconis gallopava TaxID=253628 RepID=A0A0D2AAZ8_9PEZI|nr:dihydropyrimidinase [Verruconis gallopava]KIW03785.1 dihydropyrimidinase [Verruconis gallopava]
MTARLDFDLVVTNGVCVTASDIAPLDIAIKDGKIALLAPSGSLAGTGAREIDAEGGYVMPGGVDCHVHLQEPPLFGGKGRCADTYETGTRSAIAGGTTTIVSFAPLEKGALSPLAAVRATHAVADGNCYCDYGFHLLMGNASPEALSELPALNDEGISSIKIYMTYEALQLRDDEILSVLLKARQNDVFVMMHAENGDVLNWLTDRLEAAQLFAPRYHANSRPPILEAEATNRAIALSSLIADTPILLVHISDPGAASRIRDAQTRGQPVFAETCPQYLFLTREDLAKPGFEGAKCVCAPPPRTRADQDAMWTGLRNGTFALLSSDHCPFRYDDDRTGKKTCLSDAYPLGRFRHIPNGLPGVETRMPLTLSAADGLDLTKFVEVTSTNAAKLYGLYPKKGALLPGLSDADLTVWYPDGRVNTTLTNDMLHHNVDYTPFEGRPIKNWPRYTILRGKIVWDRDNGGVVGDKTFGQFIKRGRSIGVWKANAKEFDLEKL